MVCCGLGCEVGVVVVVYVDLVIVLGLLVDLVDYGMCVVVFGFVWCCSVGIEVFVMGIYYDFGIIVCCCL